METSPTPSLSFWQDPLWPTACTQFNTQEFFECHETLETLWNQLSPGTEKQLIHGLLQFAVGLHHCQQENPHGACTLIQRGFEKLTALTQDGAFQPLLLHPLLETLQNLYNSLQTTRAVPSIPELPTLSLDFPYDYPSV